jgi:NADH-quinone oxidoreductase subunit A
MALDYLPILVMLVLAIGFPILTLSISWLLAPRQPDRIKDASYECGVDPVGDARLRHSVRFYVVAMLFIVFDLETVFLYPWAVTYKKLGLFGLIEMIVFLAILLVGYVYVWKRGALDWSEQIEPADLRRYSMNRTIGGPRAEMLGIEYEWEAPPKRRRAGGDS